MKPEILSALETIRRQINLSSYEMLPLQLTRAFLSLCDLMSQNREELEGQLSQNVLQNVLVTVSRLLSVVDIRQMNGDMYQYTCEICEDDIIMYNNDLSFSFDMHKQTENHLETVRRLEESLSYLGLSDAAATTSPSLELESASSIPDSNTSVDPPESCEDTNAASSCSEITTQTRDEQIVEVWRNLPDDFFTNEILITPLDLNAAVVWFCCGCNEILESTSEQVVHALKLKHRGNVDSLRQADISSRYYGLMLGTWKMQYCALCSVGLCSSIEIDWHVNSLASGHGRRLTQLRRKVFSKHGEHLMTSFSTCDDTYKNLSPNCSLDDGLLHELSETSLEKCLTHLALISNDNLRYCCLCDVYVKLAEQEKQHLASVEHRRMISTLKESFGAPGEKFGVISKNQHEYCVLCHIGFLNNFESQHHVYHCSRHSANLNHYRVSLLCKEPARLSS